MKLSLQDDPLKQWIVNIKTKSALVSFEDAISHTVIEFRLSKPHGITHVCRSPQY